MVTKQESLKFLKRSQKIIKINQKIKKMNQICIKAKDHNLGD